MLHRQRVLLRDVGDRPLTAALVGRHVGNEVRVVAELPPTFPLARFREASVHQVLWVREAYALELPSEESPEFLSQLGLGRDLKETLKALAQSAAEERRLQTQVLLGEDIALVLAHRLELAAEETALDAWLMTLWAQTDGRALQAIGQSAEAIEASRLMWCSEPELRELAQRQLLVRELIGRLVEEKVLVASHLSEAIDSAVDAFTWGGSESTAPLLLRLANSAGWVEAMRQLTALSCVRLQP